MSTQQQTGLVVSKSTVVQATPERAFEVFTEQIATWWPYKTHSVGGSSEGDTASRPSSSRPARTAACTRS